MKKSSLILVCLIFSAITLAHLKGASASPETWVEVTRFSGSGSTSFNTTYFTCEHIEWRIRWSYVPVSGQGESAGIIVFTYRQGEADYINWIFKFGAENTTGISNIQNQTGTFYMSITAAVTESFAVIVEQDITSPIPEFQSIVMISLFTASTFLAILAWKIKYARRRCVSGVNDVGGSG
jgi:hypothetical protein